MSVPRITGVQLSQPSAGPLLLLGTSIGTSASALWSASAAFLGERFHVVAWDLPGHGRNTEPVSAGFTMAELAAGVLAFADRVLTDRGEPGGRLYYAGDSLGGAVGLQALLDAPDRILAAVLLCTGAKIGDAEGWWERAARVRASGTTVVVNRSVERWFAPGFLEREPQVGAGCWTPYVPLTRRRTPWRARRWPTSTFAPDWGRLLFRCSLWRGLRTSRPRRTCSARSQMAYSAAHCRSSTGWRTWHRLRRLRRWRS